MTKETRTALEGSVRKWKDIVERGRLDDGASVGKVAFVSTIIVLVVVCCGPLFDENEEVVVKNPSTITVIERPQ